MTPGRWRVKRWRRLDGTIFYARYQYPINRWEAFDTWAEAMGGF